MTSQDHRFFIILEKITYRLTPEEYPAYGYGDYEKWDLVPHDEIIEAETARKAQAAFRRIWKESGRRIRFSGVGYNATLLEFPSREDAQRKIDKMKARSTHG